MFKYSPSTTHNGERIMEIGQRVIAKKMAADSFYLQVEGVVTGIKNGFVEIKANRVMDKWSKKWEDHPTSCATSSKIENVCAI